MALGKRDGQQQESWVATVHRAAHADTDTLVDSVLEANHNVAQAVPDVTIEEVVADKGYHGAVTLELAQSLGLRTYIPEHKNTQHKTRIRVPRPPKNTKNKGPGVVDGLRVIVGQTTPMPGKRGRDLVSAARCEKPARPN